MTAPRAACRRPDRRCARPHCTSTEHHAQGHCKRCYEKQRCGGLLQRRIIYIDPQPVRTRITEHQHRGRSLRKLAAAAGVDYSVLARLVTGKRRSVTTAAARRILAVALPPTDIGTMRRIQALSRMGHTWRSIATEAGVTFSALASSMTCGHFRAWVSVPVAEVFDRWSLTAGPSTHARSRAQRNNWPAPGAWTGIDIDDPGATPDLGPLSQVTAADRVTEVEHLLGMGESLHMACKAVGITPETLRSSRWRSRRAIATTEATRRVAAGIPVVHGREEVNSQSHSAGAA